MDTSKNSFKLINAGFPKTASKSCTAGMLRPNR